MLGAALIGTRCSRMRLTPVKARRYFESAPPSNEGTCTMCGKMCAMRTVNQIMDGLTIDLDAD